MFCSYLARYNQSHLILLVNFCKKKKFDISTAKQILENVLLYLKELRSNSDEAFNKFIFDATEL